MDGDKSPVKERWELGNDEGVEVPRDSIRHRSNKDVRKSSRRDEKRSKDGERSKESGKERVSSIDTRKEGRDDRTREKGRDKDGDFDKYRQRSQRDRKRKNHDREREFLKDSRRGHDKESKDKISQNKEERLKKTSSHTLSWVNKKKKRNAEKERAFQLSRVFEEQDNINQRDDTEDEAAAHHTCHDLSGLHGLLDKVIQGGAVVLTLKDQTIRANGYINEDVDMLEQYDDPVAYEGVTLDAAGRFGGEAKEKLDELRKRIDGVSTATHFQDLDSSAKTSSDYYTHQEMLLSKKPKKIKSLRKKDKLDLDALEAKAVSVGLGINDLGSTSNGKRQALKEEQEKSEAEKRNSAYQSAHARAQEASNALRPERRTALQPMEEDDDTVFGDDDADPRKSLERARKLVLEKQVEAAPSGPQVLALLASSAATNSGADNENTLSGEPQENKVVFTEMEEFVWGLQLGKEAHKPEGEDEAPGASVVEKKAEDGGWTEMQDIDKVEIPSKEKEEDIALERTIHEVAVGKGLSGALNLLKDRCALKESVEWAGRSMDKKKSKLVGISHNDGKKEIHIEMTDEYGRNLTHKEAFRLISHKFHGKGPGMMKQEKRMRQHEEELKVQKMKNSDTPSFFVERMREAQEQLKTPYLVLSGNVKTRTKK